MTLRRPIRSPRKPAITAPKRNPKGVADPMMPSWAVLGPTRSSPTEEGTRRWPRPSRRRCSRAHPSATTCSAAATAGSGPGDSADSSCGLFGCRRRLWASRSPVPGTLLDQITLPARGGRGSDQRDRRESSMATTTPTPSLARSQRRRAVLASTVGTTIEWYDFFLYGTAAALVFPQVFFPGQSPFAGVLLAFSHPVRRVRRPADRRRDLRPLRRPDRPQGHADHDPADHGRRHRPHRGAARLRHDRRCGADPAHAAADRCRASASAASGAARC